MDEIRPWLFIGNYSDTQNKSYLDSKSISAMLQLAEPVQQININSLYLPVADLGAISHDFIKQGMKFVLAEKEKGNKILIACAAGINRSTAFCIAALKETAGLNLLDAYKEIKQKHPKAMPHEPIWESLCSYYNETTPYLDMMRISIQFPS